MAMRLTRIAFALGLAGLAGVAHAQTTACDGVLTNIGNQKAIALSTGGVAALAKMNINIDGSGVAYHKANGAGGGLIHLCNAGKVYLPDGTSYQGSESNATCTGKFMDDVKRIGEAGWKDATIGLVNWFGILGRDETEIAGRTVKHIEPVERADAPGFYVSPTTLGDSSFAEDDQKRYPDPMLVPAAVIPGTIALRQRNVLIGGLGVAIDTRRENAEPAPFIINDIGPRIGEGSVALARLVAGKPIKPEITRAERFLGQVDSNDVLWVFFGGPALAPPYDAERVRAEAASAFTAWGGADRLRACIAVVKANAN
jgi:Fungal chitosanase of glycosyl hydrolase group 75